MLDKSHDLARRRGRLHVVAVDSWTIEAEYVVGLGNPRPDSGYEELPEGRYDLESIRRRRRDAGKEVPSGTWSFPTSHREADLALHGGAPVPLFEPAPPLRLEWPVGDDSQGVPSDEHLSGLLADARAVSLIIAPAVHESFRPASGRSETLKRCWSDRLEGLVGTDSSDAIRRELGQSCSESADDDPLMNRAPRGVGDQAHACEGDPWDIDGAVERQRGPIRACYDRGRLKEPDPKGPVSASFEITSDGWFADVRILENTTGSLALAECVRRQVERVQLSPAPYDRVSVVDYPFVFAPEDSVGPSFPAAPDPRFIDSCPFLKGPDGLPEEMRAEATALLEEPRPGGLAMVDERASGELSMAQQQGGELAVVAEAPVRPRRTTKA